MESNGTLMIRKENPVCKISLQNRIWGSGNSAAIEQGLPQ